MSDRHSSERDLYIFPVIETGHISSDSPRLWSASTPSDFITGQTPIPNVVTTVHYVV